MKINLEFRQLFKYLQFLCTSLNIVLLSYHRHIIGAAAEASAKEIILQQRNIVGIQLHSKRITTPN